MLIAGAFACSGPLFRVPIWYASCCVSSTFIKHTPEEYLTETLPQESCGIFAAYVSLFSEDKCFAKKIQNCSNQQFQLIYLMRTVELYICLKLNMYLIM